MRMAQEIDVVKELLDAAEKGGVDIEIVSTETPSGKQFLATLHGLGALLRY
jgi:peptide subunit release factor 1 (eRF1)